MLELDANPAPTDDGRPPANRLVASNAVAQAMYTEDQWPQLEQALADAQAGDGNGLLELHDIYFQRRDDGEYDNSLEAFQTISCMDVAERFSVEAEDEMAAEYAKVAPRHVPRTTGDYFCSFYPLPNDPEVPVTGKGAGPIVVVGTTGDPSTPLESTRNMAEALEEGKLVVVVADQHTGYGLNQCINDAVNNYLIDLTVPADDLRCE